MRKTASLVASLAAASVLAISAGVFLGSAFSPTTDAAVTTHTLTSTADAKMVEESPTTNHGDDTSLGADGDMPSGSGKDEAALIKWDLSGIAPGTPVGSASVTLSVTDSSPQTYEAYRLKRGWTESEVTWNERARGEPWEVPGDKGSLDRGAAVMGTITPSATGERTFIVSPELVQRWVDQPASNRGIVIVDSGNSDGFDFYSGEAPTESQRPRLSVELGSDPILVGAGDIAGCAYAEDSATAELLESIPGTVFTVGDNAYESGTAAEFEDCYGPTWGRHLWRTKPSVGNHEYHTAGAAGYFGYFGTRAGKPSEGYYSYNLGEWHVISLNAMCEQVGGCEATSPMVTWLKNDLAANPMACTIAYWHNPLFSSGSVHGNDPKMKPAWEELYAANADVVINGHEHNYERFAPQTPSGVADPERGIREFVVGTGGTDLYQFGRIKANSEVRNNTTHGVLKLTLYPTSYEWEFVPVAGATFTDSGTTSCH